MLNFSRYLMLFLVAVFGGLATSSIAKAEPRGWVPPGAVISGSDQPATQPSFYAGANGTTYGVWVKRYGPSYGIEFSQKPPGGKFSAPKLISDVSKSAYAPKIMASPEGLITAVWYRGGKIEAAERIPGGEFGDPEVISPDNRSATDPQISEPSKIDGATIVVWNEFGGAGARVGASVWDKNLGFSSPFLISQANQPAHGARVIYDRKHDHHFAMWIADVSGYARVQTSERIGGGSFQTPVNHSAADSNALDAEIAAGTDGTLMLVWRGNDGTGWKAQAKHWSSGNSIETLSGAGNTAYDPEVVAGPDGSFTIAWSEENGSAKQIKTSDRPAGGPFTAAASRSSDGAVSADPKILVTGDGATILTWLHTTNVGQMAIGSIREPESEFGPAVELSPVATSANNPALVSHGDGQALAAWVRLGRVEFISTAPIREEPEVPGEGDRDEIPTAPTPPAGVAHFDGKTLRFRLKCPPRFKPACRGKAVAVTGRSNKAKAMTKVVKANQKAGKWRSVALTVKPKFRAKLTRFAKSTKKTLMIRQMIRAPKAHKGKTQRVFHLYRVRTKK